MTNSRTKKTMGERYLFFLLLSLTGFCGFYSYLPLGSSLYSTDVIIIYVFGVALLFFLIALVRNKGRLKVRFQTSRNAMTLVGIIILEIVMTFINVRQPIQLTIKEGFFYITPVFCLYVLMQFCEKMSSQRYLELIEKFAIACSITATLAYLLYGIWGLNIMQIALTSQAFRNGTLRFTVGGPALYLGIIIALTKVLNKNYCFIDVVAIILCSYQIIFINKTRSVMLYLLATLLIAILLEKKTGLFSKLIISFGIVLLLVFAALSGEMISESVSSYIIADAGLLIRFDTIKFYVNQIIEHPLLGMGLISSSKDVAGWQLLYGNEGRFYRSDVGIIGMIDAFGIIGLIWVLTFFFMAFKKSQKIRNTNPLVSSVLRNYVIYLVVSMINLSFMTLSLSMCIFFVYMLIEITNYEIE